MSIEKAIEGFSEKNLDQMRENISASLSQKAAQALEEKKIEVAKIFFEQK